jgi:predicted AlkP superfamily pyrophosphatase or phosphodiesterase
MRHLTRLLSLLALLLGAPAHAAPARPPGLVVLLVVDQMRADYHDWYGAHWKGGLRRLYDQGAWLRNARYPYLGTLTCPGHFTIVTGALPHTHGMVLNSWYDRAQKKAIDCTDDPASPLVGYAPGATNRGDSARNLVVPTLIDEMNSQLPRKPRVAAFSMKARSSIPFAGHSPAVVTWFGGNGWVTSRAFASDPVPWVSRFVGANPLALETPWTRLLPESEYANQDDAAAERPGVGWGKTFPHPLTDAPGAPLARWAASPAPDEYLARLARAALAEMKLGQGPGTDVLAVSFSMTDLIGHAFGPRSHEVQDTLARLDGVIGGLLHALDERLPGGYVLALASDHGVAPVPEQSEGGGRLQPPEMKKQLNAALVSELGPGEHVADVQFDDLYLTPGVRERLAGKPGAMGRVLAALRALPGVAGAFDGAELAEPEKLEGLARAAALSYFPGRSGDIVIAPRPNWIVGPLGTNHGTTNDYDQHVPVIFFGRGIKPGTYDRPVTPADVAPTLARLIGVKLPRAEGSAIDEVLVPAPARRTKRPR